MGLATCAMSLVVLGMLGNAVVKQGKLNDLAIELGAENWLGGSLPSPNPTALSGGESPDWNIPELPALGRLEPLPLTDAERQKPAFDPSAPTYEPPTLPVPGPEQEPIEFPLFEPLADDPMEPEASEEEQPAPLVDSEPAWPGPAPLVEESLPMVVDIDGMPIRQPSFTGAPTPKVLFAPPPKPPSLLTEADITPAVIGAQSSVEPTPEELRGEPLVSFGDTEAELAGRAPIEDLLIDTPPAGQVSKLVASEVRDAFTLGRHGALYAARSQFVRVLRKVALAKDAEEGSDRHSLALAAGLGALDEAEAFVPRGNALETDLDVLAISASHKTPLFHQQAKQNNDSEGRGEWVSPHEAIARYHRYAQHKLALVAAGDEAGSMALHGLGKTYARLDELNEAPLAGRVSLTMFRAAVAAHAGNYLAANELGVGLAKAGRYHAARAELERAVAAGGTSTVYRNLAIVHQNLGHTQLAAAATMEAQRLAAAERAAGAFSRERGIDWVQPQQFTRVADAYSRQGGPRPAPVAPAVAGQPRPYPAPQTVGAPRPSMNQASTMSPSAISRVRSIASRLNPWSQPSAPPATPPMLRPQPAPPTTAPPVRSQTILR